MRRLLKLMVSVYFRVTIKYLQMEAYTPKGTFSSSRDFFLNFI